MMIKFLILITLFEFFILLSLLKYILYFQKSVYNNYGYYVYNPEGNGPQYIHKSYEEALNEARRLHCTSPCNDFMILKIETIIDAEPSLVLEDEIPF